MELIRTFPTAAEVAALSGAELDHALVDLERAHRAVEAAYLAVLDRADATDRYALDGHAGVRGWASALANPNSVELHRRLQTMRALRDLPAAASALAEGRVGVDQVREIAKLHANPRARHLAIDGCDKLVEHAQHKPFDQFSEIVGRWEAFGDAIGNERKHERANDRREARVFERNGSVHLHAKCGTLQGAELMEIFTRQCDAEFLTDWDQAKAEHGDGVHPGLLERTDAQRRMDALHTLLLHAVAAPPGSQPPEPIVNIVHTAEQYEATLAAIIDGTRPAAVSVDTIDELRCETTSGLQINPADAVAASVLGWFRRVIVDSSGVVIDLGRKRRFTGKARVAVILAGRRCLWPGCGRNTQRNQIDHTHEHSRGGLTCAHNCGPACGRHNRWKTRGYTAHRDANGVWHVHRPDGTELTQPAAAA